MQTQLITNYTATIIVAAVLLVAILAAGLALLLRWKKKAEGSCPGDTCSGGCSGCEYAANCAKKQKK